MWGKYHLIRVRAWVAHPFSVSKVHESEERYVSYFILARILLTYQRKCHGKGCASSCHCCFTSPFHQNLYFFFLFFGHGEAGLVLNTKQLLPCQETKALVLFGFYVVIFVCFCYSHFLHTLSMFSFFLNWYFYSKSPYDKFTITRLWQDLLVWPTALLCTSGGNGVLVMVSAPIVPNSKP